MKKILLILTALLLFNLPSIASITPEEAISQEYIHNHGYSDSMAELILLQNAQVDGQKSKYKSKDPDWYTSNKKVNFIRKVFTYIDPGLDNGLFMRDNISPTNRWDDL